MSREMIDKLSCDTFAKCTSTPTIMRQDDPAQKSGQHSVGDINLSRQKYLSPLLLSLNSRALRARLTSFSTLPTLFKGIHLLGVNSEAGLNFPELAMLALEYFAGPARKDDRTSEESMESSTGVGVCLVDGVRFWLTHSAMDEDVSGQKALYLRALRQTGKCKNGSFVGVVATNVKIALFDSPDGEFMRSIEWCCEKTRPGSSCIRIALHMLVAANNASRVTPGPC
jgi:hypothetical protein